MTTTVDAAIERSRKLRSKRWGNVIRLAATADETAALVRKAGTLRASDHLRHRASTRSREPAHPTTSASLRAGASDSEGWASRVLQSAHAMKSSWRGSRNHG